MENYLLSNNKCILRGRMKTSDPEPRALSLYHDASMSLSYQTSLIYSIPWYSTLSRYEAMFLPYTKNRVNTNKVYGNKAQEMNNFRRNNSPNEQLLCSLGLSL